MLAALPDLAYSQLPLPACLRIHLPILHKVAHSRSKMPGLKRLTLFPIIHTCSLVNWGLATPEWLQESEIMPAPGPLPKAKFLRQWSRSLDSAGS